MSTPIRKNTFLMALCQTVCKVLSADANSLRLVAEFAADQSIANHEKFLVFTIHSLHPLLFGWFRLTAASHAEAEKVCREMLEEQGIHSLLVLSSRPERIHLAR